MTTSALPPILQAFDLDRAMTHVRWLSERTPNRISGGGQDRLAAEYIRDTLASYGLAARLQEFDTYTSTIGSGALDVLSPEPWTPVVKPCLHIDPTPPEGVVAELVAVGPGGREDYAGLDVRGKIVLAEVSYAPATPEKARLAYEQGAIGIVLMNWGTSDQDNIPWRALKAVWGNPTRATWNEIPRLHALAITRRDGERLKAQCQQGGVEVRLRVTGQRLWARVAQPIAWLRAPESSPEREQFVVVSGHLDAWEPGVTDNASGNGVMIEIARLLAERRDELRRSVVFCFWNGHEIAEAAGSTYFVDTHWEELNRYGVAYTNIDSVGMRGADRLAVNSSPELRDAHQAIAEELFGERLPSKRLERIGDQSFFGVGVPAIAARHALPDAVVQAWNGATLGWWNHTDKDTFDTLDEAVLERDGRFWAGLIHDLVSTELLPHLASPAAQELRTRFDTMLSEGEDPAELGRVRPLLDRLAERAAWLDALQADTKEAVLARNEALLRLSRHITPLRATVVGKYGQDSYGLSDLKEPVPMLAPLSRYRRLVAGDPERHLLTTELMRVRHRFTDALTAAIEVIDVLRLRLGLAGSD